MPTLRLLEARAGSNNSGSGLLCCAYTPDGAFVLTGGWDGHLRLWEAGTGVEITAIQTGAKQVTACAVAPSGKHWFTGSSEGLLACWDAMSHRQLSIFLAHPRPISAIVFGADDRTVATASWDRTVIVWDSLQERRGTHLKGHKDIVAGCRFLGDGSQLLSWSNDNNLCLWKVADGRVLMTLTGHIDRVTAAAVSQDGRSAVSGSRNGGLHVWDLHKQRGMRTGKVATEVRGCFLLPDNETLAVADVRGRLTLHAQATLDEQAELVTNLPVEAADLTPAGDQMVLACTDGQVRFVALEGVEIAPLEVAVRPAQRNGSLLSTLFGRKRETHAYSCTCPACRRVFELPSAVIDKLAPCPHCRRKLRVSTEN